MRHIRLYENSSSKVYTFDFSSDYSSLYKSLTKVKKAFTNRVDFINYIINFVNDVIDELNKSGDYKEMIEKVKSVQDAYKFIKDLHADDVFTAEFKFDVNEFEIEVDVDSERL